MWIYSLRHQELNFFFWSKDGRCSIFSFEAISLSSFWAKTEVVSNAQRKTSLFRNIYSIQRSNKLPMRSFLITNETRNSSKIACNLAHLSQFTQYTNWGKREASGIQNFTWMTAWAFPTTRNVLLWWTILWWESVSHLIFAPCCWPWDLQSQWSWRA